MSRQAGNIWQIPAAALAFALLPQPTLAAVDTPAAAPARGLPDDQLAPLSLQMLAAGNSALGAGQTAAAIDKYEAALAADPRNREAYVGLARAAAADGLPGHAVRYYREALELDPNDRAVLELQGLALLQRGAIPRAEDNLTRLRKLCTADCPEATRLAAAIAKAPKAPAANDNAPKAPGAGKTGD